MNDIQKIPIGALGYDFIPAQFIPKGKNEYYLRNIQNRNGIDYRTLSAYEIEVLVRNRNTSDDWNNVLVSNAFDPERVKNCKFFGLVRIGKLESLYLSFNDIRLPVGLYNSTIISCDFGDNVVLDNVNYMSHYIVGNEVIIVNVNEITVSNHTKFGNGIIKDGESEAVRIWLEVCNENGGRSIIPFNGMLPGDAWIWSRYRNDDLLMSKFEEFTQTQFDNKRGYYGKIGDRTVVKNTKIIKDVWIGSDAYIKGANKLKNLTINSSPEEKSQIGEGVELVNGIIGLGCRVFYGVKAVRFILASNSQLKYGARLINSYLGNNSTISCCEVLNSLIFPAHEQHHNNSFLCAALIMGQSNIAAGATLGSNHNSRGADGEMIAARGFWPGLCVSLKHNSKFASFCLVAKSDYMYECNIPVPFALVSNDVARDRLVVMPAYWFMYNMYALARNTTKYADRDKRKEQVQLIEYDFLAPDSVNEIFDALLLLKSSTGRTYSAKKQKDWKEKDWLRKGGELLDGADTDVDSLEILADKFENSRRPVILEKTQSAYRIFKELISYYGATQLVQFISEKKISTWEKLRRSLPSTTKREAWFNVGGQLIPQKSITNFIGQVHSGKIKSWEDVHAFYQKNGVAYGEQKFSHAIASLFEIRRLNKATFDKKAFRAVLEDALQTRAWMTKAIYESRSKDYQNQFRKMVYDSKEQMDKVLGKLEENTFISQQKKELKKFQQDIRRILKSFRM